MSDVHTWGLLKGRRPLSSRSLELAIPGFYGLAAGAIFYFPDLFGVCHLLLVSTPSLSDENPVMLHFFVYTEIIFAHILVFPACAIEVQHINENSPTIHVILVCYTGSF